MLRSIGKQSGDQSIDQSIFVNNYGMTKCRPTGIRGVSPEELVYTYFLNTTITLLSHTQKQAIKLIVVIRHCIYLLKNSTFEQQHDFQFHWHYIEYLLLQYCSDGSKQNKNVILYLSWCFVASSTRYLYFCKFSLIGIR